MTKNRLHGFSLCILSALLAAACSVGESPELNDEQSPATVTEAPSGAIPGVLLVKFDSEPDDAQLSELESTGVYKLSRLYPPAGKFEKRHREAGLHLWYSVEFAAGHSLTKAADEFAALSSVGHVEFVHPVRPMEVAFNDPQLSSQWHYSNDGSKTGAVAGSDANVVKAWEIETGSPAVIVAVSDGGVDFTHPDIAKNMWVNEAELNGVAGKDDDHNGYIDDVYGYSFLASQPDTDNPGHIVFDSHGTHVAGTIAAVNNNGLGVCGIAGGDGSATSGVRIMTLQTSGGSAYIQPPFVYAADNGAVLMNCSWGFDDADFGSMQAVREAIKYFNENAGFDEHGNQTGPMAGGLAIFAAGNEDTDVAYPAMEEGVFAVAAVAHDFHRAYYSNYGSWVDISAPGGDARKSAQILSTLPGGQYGLMQGTSMACPHVTGVAALVVSHFQGPGFTREQLITILKATARSIDSYNSSYEGQLGAGLVDAARALSVSFLDPELPTSVNGSAVANYIRLDWLRSASSEDRIPYSYELFYSKNSLASLDPDNPGAGVTKVDVVAEDISANGTVNVCLEGLDFETDYHIRVRSASILGNHSDLSDEMVIHTKSNTLPVITPQGSTSVQLPSHLSADILFDVSDADGHPLTCSVSLAGTSVVLSDGTATVHINALELEEGTDYVCELSVSDGYSAVSSNINIAVATDAAPAVKTVIENIVIGDFSVIPSLDLTDYFGDADGEDLTYTVRSVSTGTIVSTTISGVKLNLKPVAYGTASIEVSAADARKKSVSQTFKVLVRDGGREVEVYPNPFTDKLYLRTQDNDTADVIITNRAGASVYSAKALVLGPFDPLELDLSALGSGVYYLNYSGSAIKDTFTIIKK